MGYKIENVLGFGGLFLALASVVAIGVKSSKDEAQRTRLIERYELVKTLRPHIEGVDGEVGTSLTDRLDLAERVGLPEEEKERMGRFGYSLEDSGVTNEQLRWGLETYRIDMGLAGLEDGTVRE